MTSFSPFYQYFKTVRFCLAEWVTTHSVRYSARHHRHNVKQKRPVLIKWAKRRYV